MRWCYFYIFYDLLSKCSERRSHDYGLFLLYKPMAWCVFRRSELMSYTNYDFVIASREKVNMKWSHSLPDCFIGSGKKNKSANARHYPRAAVKIWQEQNIITWGLGGKIEVRNILLKDFLAFVGLQKWKSRPAFTPTIIPRFNCTYNQFLHLLLSRCNVVTHLQKVDFICYLANSICPFYAPDG